MSKSQYIQFSLELRISNPVAETTITPRTPGQRRQKRRLTDARTHGIPESKVCRDCDKIKPSAEFNRDKSSRDGIANYCKECHRARNKAYWKKFDRKQERHQLQWERLILDRYGLTPDDYAAMSEKQGNVCAICKQSGPRLAVDHDHETGAIRALLCKGCNVALGSMRDNPELMNAAAEYLRKHGK